MTVRRLACVATTALLTLTLTTACSDGEDSETLTVLAASSLTGVFEQLADEFAADHEGVRVRFSFGSSTSLAELAVQGAPGDVLATADQVSMDVAADGDALAGAPVAFATNQLVLAVPAGNPAGIRSYADLADTDWVRCADDVPCGRVALTLLAAHDDSEGAGDPGDPASLEVDAKAVLGKVVSGEADAGFVYATDAQAAGDAVTVVELPGAGDARTTYFVAALDDAERDELAADWIDLLTSEVGRAALVEAGFSVK